jgi:hypothetical protein
MLALAADQGFEILFAMTTGTAESLSLNLAGSAVLLTKAKLPLLRN